MFVLFYEGAMDVLGPAHHIPHLEDVAGRRFTMIFVHAFLVVAPDLTTIKSSAYNHIFKSYFFFLEEEQNFNIITTTIHR